MALIALLLTILAMLAALAALMRSIKAEDARIAHDVGAHPSDDTGASMTAPVRNSGASKEALTVETREAPGAYASGEALQGASARGFTFERAVQLSGCTPHQLRYWDKVALVQPSVENTDGRPGRRRIYSFRDLVTLRVVKSLLDNGLSIQRVRRAWDYLRRTGDMDDQLAGVKLVTDGQSIFAVAHDESELLDALRHGQLAFFVKIDEIAQDVEDDATRFELDRESFHQMLHLAHERTEAAIEQVG